MGIISICGHSQILKVTCLLNFEVIKCRKVTGQLLNINGKHFKVTWDDSMDMKKGLRLHAFQSSIIKNPEKLHAPTILVYNPRHIIFQKVTWS